MAFRVLLLSKERRARKMFTSAADSVMVNLTIAEDMDAGLELIRAERFDAIFADAELPGLSRTSIISQVRKSRLNSQAALFLLTGYAGAAKSAAKPGSEISLLAKPSSAADLARLLERLRKKLIAERRRSGRLPLRVDVNCRKGVQRYEAFSVDLNESGMMLDLEAPLVRGDDLDVIFSLTPGETEIRVGARVVRRSGSGRLAIAFEKMENFSRQRIREFLKLHMPSIKGDASAR